MKGDQGNLNFECKLRHIDRHLDIHIELNCIRYACVYGANFDKYKRESDSYTDLTNFTVISISWKDENFDTYLYFISLCGQYFSPSSSLKPSADTSSYRPNSLFSLKVVAERDYFFILD